MVISTGDGDLGLILVIPGGGEDSEIVGEASHINSVVSFVVLSVGGVLCSKVSFSCLFVSERVRPLVPCRLGLEVTVSQS